MILNPYSFGGATGAEIDRTLGTNIGDMTFSPGLAAAFDGITSQANGSCARKTSTTTSYIGKTGNIARRISKGTAHGANDSSAYYGGGVSTTIALYAKIGSAPGNGTDGTLLGSITFTSLSDESAGRDIASSDSVTLWDHWWLYITTSGSSTTAHCAEARFFE